MKRSHLLHVFPSFETGGAQRRFLTLANHLGRGYRHTVIAMDRNFDAARGLAPDAQVDLVEPPPHKASPRCTVEMRRLIARIRPDLAMTYNWGAMDAVAGAVLASVCPVIHTEDGFGPDEAQTLKRRRVLVRRVLLGRIFRTVVPSNTLFRIALEQYRIARGKVQFIPNGVDTDRFRPGLDRRVRSALGVAENEVLFGYAGHLRPEKNLRLLLRAFAKAAIPGGRLLILGSGPCEIELRAEAADLRLGARVLFQPTCPDPAPYYGAMDVFVLSSSTEQMPISLLEAMACGLPAVCTDVGDLRTMLDSAEGSLPPAGDEQAYAEALRGAAVSREFRSSSGAKNRERATAFYSLQRMTVTYHALYQEAIQKEKYAQAN